jgi:hypothetical protein
MHVLDRATLRNVQGDRHSSGFSRENALSFIIRAGSTGGNRALWKSATTRITKVL